MRDWGKHTHGSPLYAHLVGVIADDLQLMAIINRIENTPRPNVLFASVQYLLFKGADPGLARFYRSMFDDPLPPPSVDRAFKEFVVAHSEELVDIGRSRLTQTNECRRCVALLPMVWLANFSRFHLIDLGTSAGLNLALDRYSYRWGDLEWGSGGLVLEAESRGVSPVVRDIEILSRVGLDLNPIDTASDDERLWLDALIWPEHEERRSRLRQAISRLGEVEFEMVAGDALVTLEQVLERLPDDEPAVVMNSFVLIQFSQEQRNDVERISDLARSRRPVHRVSMEVLIKRDDWARLIVDDGSGAKHVGEAHPHGDWIELYPSYAPP